MTYRVLVGLQTVTVNITDIGSDLYISHTHTPIYAYNQRIIKIIFIDFHEILYMIYIYINI